MTDPVSKGINPIVVGNDSTVVAEFDFSKVTSEGYQSEAQLEAQFIKQLAAQQYEILNVTTELELVPNLRKQLEKLNDIIFSENEWKRFFEQNIASANEGIREKARKIQTDYIQILNRDDGTSKNIRLIDKTHIHNNNLQVISQYKVAKGEGGAKHSYRYDVTILVNGLPLVHVELKKRGVNIKEAFNQINKYQNNAFWVGSGLFEYAQLFVISNGTFTKYYSNTTRYHHVEGSNGKKKKVSNSFEFTSWWADAKNQPIKDLNQFTKTFFAKHTILNILTKYCVLTVDQDLMVMRPYQIAATEKILQRIESSHKERPLGTAQAGGYVWHTTGSGKTLTSFKAAQLATGVQDVEKVLFVVDRKDLDYQTMREYDKFQKGAANSNSSTNELKKQLEDPEAKIIITTIQKLSRFVDKYKDHPVYKQRIVMIFDECHRSQFGDMHKAITKNFKRYNLFGFTGTPIFAKNMGNSPKNKRATTEQVFGDQLHIYSIVDAINDNNVLPFRIDYTNTVKAHIGEDKQVEAIDTESALLHPNRLKKITTYILDHFDKHTKRSSPYTHTIVSNTAEVIRSKRKKSETKVATTVNGFNAIFATASIEAAKIYYNQFRAQQMTVPETERLKVGLIYSYAANPEEKDIDDVLDDDSFDALGLSSDDREFLADAISDYNDNFGTSWDTESEGFQSYYKDLSMRMKNRELDILIVVNMFLTGFDATTLNTLYVDKNLRYHGLIQAFSRTNRILNSVKTYGNIVSFRNLEKETEEAIALYGNKDAKGIVILKPYREYYGDYVTQVEALLNRFPIGQEIVGETNQKDFVSNFGSILRLSNILNSFDEFDKNQIIFSDRQWQDYNSYYLYFYDIWRKQVDPEKEPIHEDLLFEIEL
ncbi:MAG: type I restriction endonuclease subunit R, partial [Microbacteriaceae bacterium]|nr:type I restriction endonuclease subunit R [Microbacteriaceae bacterium]